MDDIRNVFVFGLDDFHRAQLATIRDADRYRFHPLLSHDEAVHPEHFAVPEMLATSEAILHAFDGRVDAVCTYWDFPTSTLVPILRERFDLPGPRLEAVLRLEHKYWARLEQRAVVPELVPPFQALDPFTEDPEAALEVPYPFWIKPVKAHSSHLGFRIHGPRDFARALVRIRRRIHVFAEPFDAVLAHAELPARIAPVRGDHCIVEGIISAGHQCTLEGYVHRGRTEIYGIVDSFREGRHRSCFQRYQYPSALPRRVQRRMCDAAARVMDRAGYDGAPFNMEFFWNRSRDELWLLEVNARCSKSHSPLFHLVDGASHFQVMAALGVGEAPAFPHREGTHRVAAKFMLRAFEDAIVTRVPQEADLERFRRRFPEAGVRLLVHEGQQLSHMKFQDSYSFELAELFLGARDRKALLARYREARPLLGIELRPLDEAA